ncbi:MAG: permease prefix domain 1-containing protein [Actinomycetota bacterium]|nr:permease prefix domain 1-containing protein [Actinomycetota bacterium]
MTGPMGARPAPADSPIEACLDELLRVGLRGRLREARHLLAEAEAHLRDAAAEAEARGLSTHAAEEEAVARFGSAVAIATAEHAVQRTGLREILRQGVASGLVLGAIGGIAVGASGILAAVMRTTGGDRWITNPPSGAALSSANCARWLVSSPPGTSCAQAGLADWANDTVLFRLLAGALGVLALLALRLVRRRWSHIERSGGLPPIVVNTTAVAAFGTAGVWLAGMGIDAVVISSGHAAGQWLSAAPVALGLAVVFGRRLLCELREPWTLRPAHGTPTTA